MVDSINVGSVYGTNRSEYLQSGDILKMLRESVVGKAEFERMQIDGKKITDSEYSAKNLTDFLQSLPISLTPHQFFALVHLIRTTIIRRRSDLKSTDIDLKKVLSEIRPDGTGRIGAGEVKAALDNAYKLPESTPPAAPTPPVLTGKVVFNAGVTGKTGPVEVIFTPKEGAPVTLTGTIAEYGNVTVDMDVEANKGKLTAGKYGVVVNQSGAEIAKIGELEVKKIEAPTPPAPTPPAAVEVKGSVSGENVEYTLADVPEGANKARITYTPAGGTATNIDVDIREGKILLTKDQAAALKDVQATITFFKDNYEDASKKGDSKLVKLTPPEPPAPETPTPPPALKEVSISRDIPSGEAVSISVANATVVKTEGIMIGDRKLADIAEDIRFEGGKLTFKLKEGQTIDKDTKLTIPAADITPTEGKAIQGVSITLDPIASSVPTPPAAPAVTGNLTRSADGSITFTVTNLPADATKVGVTLKSTQAGARPVVIDGTLSNGTVTIPIQTPPLADDEYTVGVTFKKGDNTETGTKIEGASVKIETPQEVKLLEEAQKLFSEGKYLDAIRKYNEVLKISPDNAFAWMGKGMAYLRMGQAAAKKGKDVEAKKLYGFANTCFSNVIKQKASLTNEDYAAALALKGFSFSLLGDDASARKFYEYALTKGPNNVTALNGIGFILLKEGKKPQALIYFEKVLKINPKDADALRGKKEAKK